MLELLIDFSSTLSEPLSWPNTRLVAHDPVAAVREMKNKAATPMRTIGSLTLGRALLKAGLVDRYPDVALEMTGSRTFDGRIQLLEYVPAILSGPPARR